MERTRLMFNYKALLELHREELAAIVTRNHGKTLEEARGEVRRGTEMVDFACGRADTIAGPHSARGKRGDGPGLLPVSGRGRGRNRAV